MNTVVLRILRIVRGGRYSSLAFSLLLLLHIIVFALLSWVLPIQYEENDDVMMCMIANGIYGGEPDCHLVFINAIIGYLLKSLYNVTHAIEWYTLMLAIIQIVSMSTLAYQIITADKFSKWLKICCCSLLYLFWIRIIATFQFTTTSGISAFAGCVILLNGKKWDYIYAFLLILTSALIRIEVALMMLLLFSPLFLRMVISYRKHIVTFTILTLLVISCPLIDNTFYSTPEWKYFKQYNTLRGKINDNPNFFRAKEKLPDGISYDEDYHMFLWGVGDGKVFSLDKVRDIYNTLHHPSFMVKLKHFKNIVVSKKYFIPVLIILLLTLLVIINTKSSYRWYLLAIIGLFIGVFVLISMNAYVKDRVFLCMLLPISYALTLSMANEYDNLSKKLKWCILGCFLVMMCFYDVSAICRNNETALLEDGYAEQCSLLQQTKDYVYDFDCGIAMKNVWHIKDFPAQPIILGWLTYIPLSKHILLGYDDFVKNNIVIFSEIGNTTTVDRIQNYLLNKYDMDVQYSILNQSEHYILYQITQR